MHTIEVIMKPENAPMPPKSIFDKLGEKPPAAELVGWELVDYSKEEQWVKVSFIGRDQFKNPTGFVQGGFLVAMLDEVMGSAIIISTDAAYITTTISINVDFVRPAPAGPLFGEGRVTSLGKSVAFLEGKLTDANGKLVARATTSCRLTPLDPSWLVQKEQARPA